MDWKNVKEAIEKLQELQEIRGPLMVHMYCRFCKRHAYVEYPISYKCPYCNGPWLE